MKKSEHVKFTHYTAAEIRAILSKVRKAKKGMRVKTIRHAGVSPALFYRWRRMFEKAA